MAGNVPLSPLARSWSLQLKPVFKNVRGRGWSAGFGQLGSYVAATENRGSY